MAVQSLTRLLKRMSLPSTDLPYQKRQRMSPQICRKTRKTRKRKRSLLTETREVDEHKSISLLLDTKELPEEVIQVEILTRLPIKSVVRFKSVCKSWLSLFSSPQFVKKHNARQNPDDYDCLVADETECVVIFSRYEKTFVLDRDWFRDLIGSANGLVCVGRDNIVSLWNPATHQSKEIHLMSPLGCVKKVGFGFDRVSKDYKVAICYFKFSNLCFAVYSSNSGTWIEHRFNDPAFENRVLRFYHSRTPDTMVLDCPYWTCSTTRVLSDKVNLSLDILKFDTRSNKFKMLPEFSSDFNNEKMYKAVNMRDLLALVFFERCTGGEIDVYSLDEKKQCGGWSKMYRLGSLEHFWRIRDLQQGFKHADESVFNNSSKIYRYDEKTNTSVCNTGTKPVSLRNCFKYTPSLVSLQGMKSIRSEN